MILHLSKSLTLLNTKPESVDGVNVRTFTGEADIAVWLRMREESFADESPMVGRWDRADFARELLDKPWWRPELTWFALADVAAGVKVEVGTITLAVRQTPSKVVAAVHWLMVLPAYRHRGIAQLLLQTLELEATRQGFTEIHLETHRRWQSAVKFYEAAGYH